jgi:hypothetical protein
VPEQYRSSVLQSNDHGCDNEHGEQHNQSSHYESDIKQSRHNPSWQLDAFYA